MEKKYPDNSKIIERYLDGSEEDRCTGVAQTDNDDNAAEGISGQCSVPFHAIRGRLQESVCGVWGWYNKKSGEVRRFYCGKRTCKRSECRRIFHWRRVRLVAELCREHRLRYFFTLTLDPKNIKATGADPWLYIPKAWGNFTRIVRRKYPKVKYVAVLEKHKNNDRPHIHGFWNMFLPWEWIRERWEKCHGGKGYYVEEVRTNESLSEYVGKQLEVHRYIGKDCVVGVPGRVKRTLWRSTGMKASFELTTSSEWCIMKEDVFDDSGTLKRDVVGSKGGCDVEVME